MHKRQIISNQTFLFLTNIPLCFTQTKNYDNFYYNIFTIKIFSNIVLIFLQTNQSLTWLGCNVEHAGRSSRMEQAIALRRL